MGWYGTWGGMAQSTFTDYPMCYAIIDKVKYNAIRTHTVDKKQQLDIPHIFISVDIFVKICRFSDKF